MCAIRESGTEVPRTGQLIVYRIGILAPFGSFVVIFRVVAVERTSADGAYRPSIVFAVLNFVVSKAAITVVANPWFIRFHFRIPSYLCSSDHDCPLRELTR